MFKELHYMRKVSYSSHYGKHLIMNHSQVYFKHHLFHKSILKLIKTVFLVLSIRDKHQLKA